jgi:hypothetical protein
MSAASCGERLCEEFPFREGETICPPACWTAKSVNAPVIRQDAKLLRNDLIAKYSATVHSPEKPTLFAGCDAGCFDLVQREANALVPRMICKRSAQSLLFWRMTSGL